jgi:hypothetical protein
MESLIKMASALTHAGLLDNFTIQPKPVGPNNNAAFQNAQDLIPLLMRFAYMSVTQEK